MGALLALVWQRYEFQKGLWFFSNIRFGQLTQFLPGKQRVVKSKWHV